MWTIYTKYGKINILNKKLSFPECYRFLKKFYFTIFPLNSANFLFLFELNYVMVHHLFVLKLAILEERLHFYANPGLEFFTPQPSPGPFSRFLPPWLLNPISIPTVSSCSSNSSSTQLLSIPLWSSVISCLSTQM